MTDAARPVAPSERILALDVIRGAAVLGILVMNIRFFALPEGATTQAVRAGGAGRLVFYLQDLFFDGRMRGLFSMLFGAGALLFVRRAIAGGAGLRAADLYYRRLLWLLLFGLLHAWVLLWPGDILYGYALSGLFLFPLRDVRPRNLVLGGLLLLSVAVPQSVYDYARNSGRWELSAAALAAEADGRVPDEAQAAALEWRREREENWGPSSESMAEQVALRRAGYASIWRDAAGTTYESQSSGQYESGIFDQLGMMLIGMALFASGFFEGRWRRSRYLLTVALGLGLALPLSAWLAWDWVRSGAPVDGFVADLIYDATYHYVRLGMALAYAALGVLGVGAGWLPALTRRLAAAGRMAFTNYIAQTLICGVLVFGPLLDLFGALSLAELMGVVLAIWVLQLAVSPWWLARFGAGPLESLWRSLTYGGPLRLRARARPAA